MTGARVSGIMCPSGAVGAAEVWYMVLVAWLKTLYGNLTGLPSFGWGEALAFIKAVLASKSGGGN